MKQNLDALKDEIQQHLEREGFLVFHGFSRPLEGARQIRWNTRTHPDFRPFANVARQVGAKMLVLYAPQFDTILIDETLSELEEADLPRDEKRAFERRLREIRAYEGFTHEIQLSFDYEGYVYLFELQTEWFDDYQNLLDEIDASVPEDDDDEDGPIGGYFSNN
jgi:hypothetical protein